MTDPRDVLLARQAELRERLRAHEGDSRVQHAEELLNGHVDGGRAGNVDREVDVALGEQERAALCEIDAALERLQEGRYGHCAECGEAIAPARLAVLPQALYCIDCERRRESAHGRAPSPTL